MTPPSCAPSKRWGCDRDDLPTRERINQAYVHNTALKPLLPALLLGRKVAGLLRNVLKLIVKQTNLHRENAYPQAFEIRTDAVLSESDDISSRATASLLPVGPCWAPWSSMLKTASSHLEPLA